jgi:hypothetical protein
LRGEPVNGQNRNQLASLCGGTIPPSVEEYVEEAYAAHRRIKGGEFSAQTMLLLWMRAVERDEDLMSGLISNPTGTQEDWEDVEADTPVIVNWAGLHREGKFAQIDPDSSDRIIVSMNDVRGDTQSVPVVRVTLKKLLGVEVNYVDDDDDGEEKE